MADSKKLKQREDIDRKYKWNIEAMYADETEWEADYAKSEELAEAFSGCLLYTSQPPESDHGNAVF